MRKILFGLLAVVLFASCEDKTAYTIKGTVDGVEDGTEVILYADRRGKEGVDTTTIKGGKFAFEGKLIEPVARFLVIKDHDVFKRPTLMVVEPGNITVSVNENSKAVISGTLNEKYFKFWQDVAAKKEDSFDTNSLKDFIKENITNVLGVYLFEANAYMHSFDELKATYALVPEQYRSLPIMVKIAKNIESQENTAVGKKITDIKGLTPEGEAIALSDYAGKGKIVLIDFWASWCPPCVADMPHLVAAYAKYKDKGFEIVGVSIDHESDKWKDGIAKLGITWPQMSDLKGWESELSKPYAVSSIPHTILVDKDGTIMEKQIHGKDLDAKLAELFK